MKIDKSRYGLHTCIFLFAKIHDPVVLIMKDQRKIILLYNNVIE